MTSLVQVRIDKKLKEDAEALFADLGLDITTALRMFLKEAVREQKIPLKLQKKDPFYSEKNMVVLKHSIKELENNEGIIFSLDEFSEFGKALENAKNQEEAKVVYEQILQEKKNA